MSDKLLETAQRISAMADGQLHGEEFMRGLDDLAGNAQARQTWDVYHLVGEVMRSGDAGARPHDPMFVQALRHKLSADNPELSVDNSNVTSDVTSIFTPVQSANDFWWRRVAGLASFTLMGVLAWQGYQFVGEAGTVASVAQLAPTRVTPVSPVMGASGPLAADRPASNTALVPNDELQATMIRDPRLDALLAAHRQFGGTSALQMPSGFLRNATFEESSR
jgi:sigma-E factor negative regulatory protein RseA